MAPLSIEVLPLLSDNYAYLLRDPASGMTAVVDPSEAEPVLRRLEALAWDLNFILNTHHHPDHCGGNLALKKRTGAQVVGPAADRERIPGLAIAVSAAAPFFLGEAEARIFETPGHTRGAICYYFAASEALFTGDTLFSLGCGRLFEGTAAQLWASVSQFAALPESTRVFCGHEYTEHNAAFARTVDAENPALAEMQTRVQRLRKEGTPTVPSLLKDEWACNPFLRPRAPAIVAILGLTTSGPVKVFAELRRRKDHF